jgi:polysaccharide export outer membrane protein
MQGIGRHRRQRGLGAPVLALVAALAAITLSAGARGQQRQQPQEQGQRQEQQGEQQQATSPRSRAAQSPTQVQIQNAAPLVLENLDRVAASAAQIRGVVSQDPGLMLELKRLVAMQASNHGQVLTEGDLSDQAIYNRLDGDVKFRAAATRLLQRYGYLMPTVNPKSEAGQERKLLLQERAIQLAKMKEQQRTATTPPPLQQTSGCDPLRDRNCLPAGSYGGTSPLGEQPSNAYPPPGQPSAPGTPGMPSAGSREIRASLTGTGYDGLSSSTMQAYGSPSGQAAAAAMAGAGAPAGSRGAAGTGSLFGTMQQFPPPGYGSIGENPAMAAGGAQPAVYNSRQPSGAPYANGPGYPYRPWSRSARGEGAPALVHRENPFADIPSLYDMYMQAASRPAKPERFGMDVFHDTNASNQMIPMDLPVGPSYVVGPGDGLTIDLWGGVSERLFRVVDRTGRVTLPEVGPVLVSGRTLGQVQTSVQQLLRTQFRSVSADVSITRLRTVRVYVVGDVEHPGAYDVSSLSTPLNAIFAAGGPTRIGSLRALQHWRGDKLLQTVDLYDLLLHGVRSNLLPLSNGDTIRVPTLGPQVTVEGMVRRPAVYELRTEKSLADVINLAGGILPAATLKHIEVQRLVAHQKRTMLSLNISDTSDATAVEKQLSAFHVEDGDVVHVFPMAPYNQNAVYLEGHVIRPGKYAYQPGMKLTDLIGSYKDLLPQPSSYAEIIRLRPPDDHPAVESFNLAKVLKNPAAAPKLEPLDTVRIYGKYDFEDVPTVWVSGDVRHPGLYRTSGQVHLRDAVELAGGISPDANLKSAQVFHHLPNSQVKVVSVNLGKALAGNPMDNILLGPRDSVLVHRNLARSDPATVYVMGAVARPGRYPLAVNMRVSDLIRVGGGLKRSADPSEADLTRYLVHRNGSLTGEHFDVSIAKALADDPRANLPLHNGDTLTIRQLPGWQDIGASVSVEGEVVHPGSYGIRPGERLSALLERAGGFLPTAYPEGIVFERDEVRRLQAKSRQELIQQLKQQSATFKTSLQTTASEQAQLQQAAYNQSQRAITALEQAPITGRMVIRMPANLARFKNSPDDITLRAGDSIVIPKRPQFVLVNGQVYNSNAITYTPHRNAEWYLRQAGGPTPQANKGNIFIIRANGSIVSGKSSGWWLHGGVLSTEIQPGDTIVVPEKAVGGSAVWKNIIAVAQVAQSAAVTALVVGKY